MSWLSEFLGQRKVKTPAVKEPEELAKTDDFDTDAYLKMLARKKGFASQIKTGNKPGFLALGTLAPKSYLGAR